ncbi:MAG: ABC transporter ATP-binding protein [Bauldia sp.]|uniref:ABC transporter ATP-binding protein n=1 Tax=Bauldia sp. TaxID=2575872 RepID=UPI001DF7C289|nr:ABC transporter ATP-binding protein [Bauldia sp.]MCB1497401.1 ABC transporter ATP-binding protein [Bauldia sp.]
MQIINSIRAFLKPDPKGPWDVVARLFREGWRKYLPGYAIASFFMVFVAGTTALTAWIIGDVVDQVFIDRSVTQLIILATAVVVISSIRGISMYGSTVALARTGNAVVADMQKRVYDHVLNLGIAYFDKTHSSMLITAVSNRAGSASAVLSTVLTSLVRDLLSVVGLVTVMIIKSPWLSVVVIVIGPLALFGVGRLVHRIRSVARSEFAGMQQIIASMQETAIGIRVVKAFNLESAMRTRMTSSIESVRRRGNKISQIKARTSPLMETLGGFAVAGVILWAGYATIYEGQKPGAFMSFITAILLAYEPAKRLANTRVGLERNVVGVRFVYDILDTPATMDTNPDGPDLEITAGEIRFDDVNFGYRKKKLVLRDFKFQAEGGKVTALVGPSGGGKSTIMNLIERFYDIRSGTITIDGQDISKVRIASLHDQIALVSQHTTIFRGTIRENIRFGRPSATDEEVETAAKNAMAHDFIMATPDGFETELEEGSGLLSGGQLQRLAIARAMLRDAPIILLDEATSSLDSESEHQIQVAFERLMAGRTTIVIAHRLSTVLGASKICVVEDGKITESGRHAELLAAGKRYARLYQLQFQDHPTDDDDEEGEPKVASVG